MRWTLLLCELTGASVAREVPSRRSIVRCRGTRLAHALPSVPNTARSLDQYRGSALTRVHPCTTWAVQVCQWHKITAIKQKVNLEMHFWRQSKNLDGWQEGSMSLAGRMVLIDLSLNSGLIYYMSLFRFHKTVNSKLMKRRRSFF
jgi:hypothetical protein